MTAVFIVDRYELVRRGLVDLIDRCDDLRVAGETSDASQALGAIASTRPHVVVIEIRNGYRDGIELCRAVVNAGFGTRCLLLADDSGDDLMFDAISAGAAGYLLDRASGDEVLAAIRTVSNGRSLLDPALTHRVFARLRTTEQPATTGIAALTPQERRVLDHVSAGMTNRQIARQCGIAEKTVKNHVSSILRKLEFSSRTQAALYARESA
ncbi:MAG TPA: response regulator transcription factor [Mycobacteriales bacterium]|nr:response regulator transcription factor [Mycobacteriales bacterium]